MSFHVICGHMHHISKLTILIILHFQWSFGVLMWELLTRGCTPYPDIDNFDVKDYVMRGNRMDKPDFAPTEL